MKVRVVLNVEVDPAEWAEHAGIDPAARTVANDVKAYTLNQLQQTAAPIRDVQLAR